LLVHHEMVLRRKEYFPLNCRGTYCFNP